MSQNKISLFHALDENFINRIMYAAKKEYLKGDKTVFSQGDPAINIYFLQKGEIKLTIGKKGRLVYNITRVGEFFGWSSLTGGAEYTATAQTVGNTRLLSISRDDLYEIMEKDPVNALLMYERIAAILGTRLTSLYEDISGTYVPPPLSPVRDAKNLELHARHI